MNDLGLSYNLLFLEEPWVLKVSTPNCSQALMELVRWIRTHDKNSPANLSTDMAAECFPADPQRNWGFNGDTYNAILQQVAARESLGYSGFIAHSFGAVRLGYLRNVNLDWSILIRPFPVGIEGRAIVKARARTVDDVQQRIIQQDGLPRALIPMEAEHRLNYLSALVELGYIQKSNTAEILSSMKTDAEAARRLAQQYWETYGMDAVSPGYLAYLEEVCSAATDWPDSHGRYKTVASVLEAKHVACSQIGREPAELTYGDEPSCIVTSSSDTVTPLELVSKSVFARKRPTWISSREPVHTSFDKLDTCLKLLARKGMTQ